MLVHADTNLLVAMVHLLEQIQNGDIVVIVLIVVENLLEGRLLHLSVPNDFLLDLVRVFALQHGHGPPAKRLLNDLHVALQPLVTLNLLSG